MTARDYQSTAGLTSICSKTASLKVACGQHVKSPSSCWFSRQVLLLQISSYPNSSRWYRSITGRELRTYRGSNQPLIPYYEFKAVRSEPRARDILYSRLLHTFIAEKLFQPINILDVITYLILTDNIYLILQERVL